MDEGFNLADSWFQMQTNIIGGDGALQQSLILSKSSRLAHKMMFIDNSIRTSIATSLPGNVVNFLVSDHKGEQGTRNSLLNSSGREESAAPLPSQLSSRELRQANSAPNQSFEDDLVMPQCVNLHESVISIGLRGSKIEERL